MCLRIGERGKFFFLPSHIRTGILRNPIQVSTSRSGYLTILSERLDQKVECEQFALLHFIVFTTLFQRSQSKSSHNHSEHFQHYSSASYIHGQSSQMGKLKSLAGLLSLIGFTHNASTTIHLRALFRVEYLPAIYQVFPLHNYKKCTRHTVAKGHWEFSKLLTQNHSR